ncbi:hypothetical protein M8J75_008999 [Diaphorina citri]|nr:hypothetical protein M8J75_008999 [Diaphorina citri]
MTTLGASVWCSLPASNSSRALTFRTSLHVARSLNPESTENLSVKTKSGDLATIIVKKREGGRNIRNFWIQDDTNWKPITSTSAESVSKQRSFSANNFVTSGNVTSFDAPVKNDESSSSSVTQSPTSDKTRSEINKIETPKNTSPQNNTADVKSTVNPDSKQDQAKSTAAPSDSNVQKLESTEVFGGITSSPYPSEKTTRSVQTSAGVSSFEVYPIQGSAGKHSGSNFVPIQSQFQARKLVPDPITVTSSMSLGNQGNTETEEDRQSRKLYVDPDGIPVITGIRVPDDESDRQVWRNARVINGILVPYAKNHNSKYPQKVSASNSHPTVQPASTQWLKSELNQKKPMPTVVKDSAAPGKWSEKKMSPTIPPPLNVMLIEEQDDKWQKLGTVYNSNNGHGQEQESKFRPSPVWIRDDVRQSQDESYVSDKILDYIKQINQHETSHRLVRKVEDRDARAFLEEEAGRSIHPRAIQRVGDNINSNYYTSSTISPPRVSFEGVRTPVLQYAHPELGVQPAKLVSTSAPQKEAELEPVLDSRAQALAYFAHDIHADRSPFAFEPGLEEEARVQENLDAKPVKPSTRPKKTLTYPSPKYVDSNMGHGHYNKYEYSSKYPFSYKGYGGGYYTHIHEPEKPMWKEISDSVKDHVQSGIEKMSNLTRPVVEPLMEATHKISQNLGLSSGNRDLNTIKEKVGLAGSPSILLPALGLVAGGAALGLGAVAVGRYLHMDVTHMRSNDEQQRNLDQIVTLVNNTQVLKNISTLSEPTSTEEIKKVASNENPSRQRRSTDNEIELENTPINDFVITDEQKRFLSNPTLWKNSGCVNKIFCEIMIAQPQESYLLLESKMIKYIESLNSSLSQTMLPELASIMNYVRRRNCSQLVCSYRM